MKHKKLFTTATLLCFMLTLFPSSAFAAKLGANVTATIPTFKVTMNEQIVDNTYREYPFLVYNDITYFPMTYWDMRFLGVSNTWSAETGSVIVADGSTSEYKPTLSTNKNKAKNTATVNSGAFKVNGKTIDNAKEKYPILSFRNVPYFPLTWDWCQEFGWHINFDATNGLAVNTTSKINKPTSSTNTEIKDAVKEEPKKVYSNDYYTSGINKYEEIKTLTAITGLACTYCYNKPEDVFDTRTNSNLQGFHQNRKYYDYDLEPSKGNLNDYVEKYCEYLESIGCDRYDVKLSTTATGGHSADYYYRTNAGDTIIVSTMASHYNYFINITLEI